MMSVHGLYGSYFSLNRPICVLCGGVLWPIVRCSGDYYETEFGCHSKLTDLFFIVVIFHTPSLSFYRLKQFQHTAAYTDCVSKIIFPFHRRPAHTLRIITVCFLWIRMVNLDPFRKLRDYSVQIMVVFAPHCTFGNSKYWCRCRYTGVQSFICLVSGSSDRLKYL